MRLAAYLLMIVLLQASLSGEAQTVSFSGKDVPLKEIFTVIKNQAGVFFFYDASVMQDAKPVTIEWKNVALQAALNEIFKDQPLNWVMEDKTVTVIKKPGPRAEAAPPPLLIHVKGIISDGDGHPISGASVLVEGTNTGTVSDDAGKFSIEAYPKNLLLFSYVNYSNKKVRVEKGEMNIKLQLDIKPKESL